jgi:predicted O-methyltransferase YrrM
MIGFGLRAAPAASRATAASEATSGPEPAAGPTPATIHGYFYGFYKHAALLAGMQLDVFTPLASGPLPAEGVADALGLDPSRVKRVLDALVVADLLSWAAGLYANTPEAARFLVRGQPTYIGGAHELYADLWSATLHSAASVREGRPQAKHDFGAMSEAALAAFLRGHHPAALGAGHKLASALDLARHRHLLEVGGGSAGLAIAACEACPELRATVVELPRVAPITQEFVAEAGLGARIEVAGHDVTVERMDGPFDVAILRNFVQVLGRADAQVALRHVVKALVPGGMLHILGWMRADDGLAPVNAVLHDLVFLNVYDAGEAYPEAEVCGWLSTLGCAVIARGPAPAGSGGPGFRMISARKPGD